jgi:pyruvate dehydrogenase E2 component (dihydrolipoamide acetyltransferase)
MLTLTLTCDHRVLYGVEAAGFLAGVAALLEQPLTPAL